MKTGLPNLTPLANAGLVALAYLVGVEFRMECTLRKDETAWVLAIYPDGDTVAIDDLGPYDSKESCLSEGWATAREYPALEWPDFEFVCSFHGKAYRYRGHYPEGV